MPRYALSLFLLLLSSSSSVFAQYPPAADPAPPPPDGVPADVPGAPAAPPAAAPAPPPAAAPAPGAPAAPATPAGPPAPPATPLSEKHFDYPAGIPYKVDTDTGPRGIQYGYNLCNATTEGQTSKCQTAFVNSIDDFCVWGPPDPNSAIGNTEGESVAWCTKPGRGTRLIPANALTGVQFMRTPDYLQVVGFIDQTKIDIAAGDGGGELDPHGADLRGNPLGGLVYSNGFPSNNGNNNTYQQVIEWHNFMGNNQFCFKVCDPTSPSAAKLCEHIYDRIGCQYNAPNAAQDKSFVSCQGENQDPPGVYTGVGGVVMTYTQPAESLGPIASVPYTPRVPASSNCVSFKSEVLYPSLPGSTSAGPSATATGAPNGGGGGGGAGGDGGAGATRTSGGNGAKNTSGARGGVVGRSRMGVVVSVVIGMAAVGGVCFV